MPPSEPGGLQGIVTVQAALESLGSTITSFTERSVGEPPPNAPTSSPAPSRAPYKRPPAPAASPLDPPPTVSIETGHPRHNALIQATIDHVADRGYEAASIDAARRRQQAAIASSTTWLEELTTRQSRPRAEATFIRAVLHPNRRTDQRISSEELRLAIHASDLANNFQKTAEQIAEAALGHIDPITLGYAYSVRAVGEGIGLLTLIDANVWRLPFEIILVPLQATLSDAYLSEAPASGESSRAQR